MDTLIPGPKGTANMPDFMKGPGEGAYIASKDGAIELWTHQIGPFHSAPMPQEQVEDDLPLHVQRAGEGAVALIDSQIKRGRFDNREDLPNQKPPRRR